MGSRILQQSFGGGEVAPDFFGRVTDGKFQSGLASCRNMIVLPHGPAANRPGTQFVREVKDSTKRVRLIPLAYSAEQSMAIELGNQYIRFHTQGATLLYATPAMYRTTFACTFTTGTPLVVNSTNHGLAAGTAIRFTTTGTLPTGIGTTLKMYVLNPTADAFNVAYTPGGAAVGAGGSPSGSHGIVPVYFPGDLVELLGLTFYCIAESAGNTPPNATYWHQMPASMIYEIPSPFLEEHLADIHYVQANDVLTLVHPSYAPRELRRLGATKWELRTIDFTSSAPTPSFLQATAPADAGTAVYTYSYTASAVAADGVDESLPATPDEVSTVHAVGESPTQKWLDVVFLSNPGAAYFNVYRNDGAGWGFIGQVVNTGTPAGGSMRDPGVIPDLTRGLLENPQPFASAGDWPAAVSYFQQRRVFAGTANRPQGLWMTRTGTESNMLRRLPLKDDDPIAIRIAAREANSIRHVVPLNGLVLMTAGAEFRARAAEGEVVTPTNIQVEPQSYVGASNVQPVIVNTSAVYAAARGGHVRELGYSDKLNGFATGDLSLRAPHLFDGLDIVDMAYSKAPYPVVWCVSSSGALLGLTYVPEQEIGAWHRHDTDGVFESICCVAEGREDVLYAVVRRTIGGGTKRYVERMRGRLSSTPREDAFHVDCGLTYSGAAATTISGLSHLNGKTVSILADGAVHPQRVVSGGAVTLDVAASKVHVGLPIVAELETLPLSAQLDAAFGHGRTKNINAVYLRVAHSSGFFAGPNEGSLREAKVRTDEPYGSPPSLRTQQVEVPLDGDWNLDGQVLIRHVDPIPLTAVSLAIDVTFGG